MKRRYGFAKGCGEKPKSNLQASLKENKGLEFWPKIHRFVETRNLTPTSPPNLWMIRLDSRTSKQIRV